MSKLLEHHISVIDINRAGVIGLQTALTLLEAGYKVTIIAKHWPGDESIEYCSPWAGAIWRTHASPNTDTSKWDLLSYNIGVKVAEEEPVKATDMGILKCVITIFSNNEPPWYAGEMQDFAVLKPTQIPANTSRHGYTFAAIAINPLTYLNDLLRQVKVRHAQCISAELADLHSFLKNINDFVPTIDRQEPSVVINCTGFSAKSFCNDEAMYPIRGQTLLARIHPPPKSEILLWEGDGEVTYIVPRPGTDMFLLGGTKTADAWEPEPIAEISNGITERCSKLLGADVRFEILAEQVGLRPGRNGGARVELEEVIEDGKIWPVIHCYGHAGGGFQGSIGSAHKVLDLVSLAFVHRQPQTTNK